MRKIICEKSVIVTIVVDGDGNECKSSSCAITKHGKIHIITKGVNVNKYILAAFVALLSGCNLIPNDDTNGGSGGCEEGVLPLPMELPTGWYITYDAFIIDGAGVETQVYDDIELDCYLTRSVGGRAIDYCGFTAEVFEKHYSFDMLSVLDFTNSGFGDSNGAEIVVTGPNDSVRYVTTHISEF